MENEVIINNLNQATLTVTVKMSHLLSFRIWLGMKIIQLGAWVATVGFEIEDESWQ